MIGELSKEEINRKLLHLLAIILPIVIFYLPIVWGIHKILVCCLIFILLFFSLLIEYYRLRVSSFALWFTNSFGSMMRAEEKNQPRLPIGAVTPDGHLGLSQRKIVLLLTPLDYAFQGTVRHVSITSPE